MNNYEVDEKNLRYSNLYDGLMKCRIAWSIETTGNSASIIDVMMNTSLVCQIEVNDEFYKISTPYIEWQQHSQKRWELEDENVMCFVDMPDECIGEIERMVLFLRERVGNEKGISFKEQMKESQLEIPNNWKGDVRSKLTIMLKPLIEGSEYYLVNNYTDTQNQILELHKNGINKRLMGFSGKRDTTIPAFFNKAFYDEINSVIDLPENRLPKKTQPHVTLTVEELWNVVCVAVGKNQYMI